MRAIGRTKGGMNTKLHAVTDADGRPIRFFMTAGEVSDYTGAAALLGGLPKADWLLADGAMTPTGSETLVYELCIGTGQRIGDVLKIRWGQIKDGAYGLTQGKTDKQMWIPLKDRLNAYLATIEKKGLTIITDAQGRPVHYQTVADEMRKVKAAMKHPDAAAYVTHGLRKNATIELCKAGCDDEMVKAVTGHSGVEMLKKYGGMVRQRELATRAQEARNRMEQNKPGT